MDTQVKKLIRPRHDRVLVGVCSGLGNYFGIDHTVVRLIFLLGTILGAGSFIIVYLVMWIVVPENVDSSTPPAPPVPPVM